MVLTIGTAIRPPLPAIGRRVSLARPPAMRGLQVHELNAQELRRRLRAGGCPHRQPFLSRFLDLHRSVPHPFLDCRRPELGLAPLMLLLADEAKPLDLAAYGRAADAELLGDPRCRAMIPMLEQELQVFRRPGLIARCQIETGGGRAVEVLGVGAGRQQ